MSLRNLRDAGGLIPTWVAAMSLNVVCITLYVLAQWFYEPKPSSEVSAITTASISLALVLAGAILVTSIVRAKNGEVAQAAINGLNSGLNLSWATAACATVAYVGWRPVSELVLANLTLVSVALASCLVVAVAYVISKPPKSVPADSAFASIDSDKRIALHPDFQQTPDQRPVFQATIADLTRLITHQAGRAIGYTGSNILFDDSFSLELDVNARVGRVYSNTNLINTEDFMYWRLHMLLMGPAAEKVLTGRTSEVAVDDLTNFDDLAGRYLMLRNDRTYNAAPVNQQEAALKAARIGMLRKNIYDRCTAACNSNKGILVDLVKLMRTRSVLAYGDIRSQLDRVVMPDGFPVAQFDAEEILQKALLEYEEHEEVTLEGAFSLASPTDSVRNNEQPASDYQSTVEADRAALSSVHGARCETNAHGATNYGDRLTA